MSGQPIHPGVVAEHTYENLSMENLTKRQSLFPWSADVERQPDDIKHAKIVPRLGLGVLAGSAFTVFLSLAILLGINGKAVWPNEGVYKLMQPASWLSGLLSLNGILINIALSEGITIAWWFQATKKDTTVAQLHETWATGTSALQALRMWRHCNYVSLAALFVAIIPINGFMLQGAITTPVADVTTNFTIPVPIVKFLDLGYSSGSLRDDGYPQTVGGRWSDVWQQVQLAAWSPYTQYAYFGSVNNATDKPYSFGYNNFAPYTTRVAGAGFEMSCNSSTYPFDLVPTKSQPETGDRIFSSSMTWTPDEPNTIYLDLWWKATTSCVGEYEVRNCVMQAATVEYPMQIQMNISGSSYVGPFFSLAPGTNRKDDRVLDILPVFDLEGQLNSTYGGIFNKLRAAFNSSLDITDSLNFSGSVYGEGDLWTVIEAEWISGNNPYNCNLTFAPGLDKIGRFQALGRKEIDGFVRRGVFNESAGADLPDVIFERLRQAMFLASVYEGSQAYTDIWKVTNDLQLPYPQEHYTQNVTASQTLRVAKYEVRFYMWAISLIITWATVAFVIPTFYGYWALSRQPSMSPVDVARVFNPPVLNEVDAQLTTRVLLKEVGAKNIHLDLKPDTAPSSTQESLNKDTATVTVSEAKE